MARDRWRGQPLGRMRAAPNSAQSVSHSGAVIQSTAQGFGKSGSAQPRPRRPPPASEARDAEDVRPSTGSTVTAGCFGDDGGRGG